MASERGLRPDPPLRVPGAGVRGGQHLPQQSRGAAEGLAHPTPLPAAGRLGSGWTPNKASGQSPSSLPLLHGMPLCVAPRLSVLQGAETPLRSARSGPLLSPHCFSLERCPSSLINSAEPVSRLPGLSACHSGHTCGPHDQEGVTPLLKGFPSHTRTGGMERGSASVSPGLRSLFSL